ncbi:hypothetical protein C5167_018544 [Papaver somniferum]|uniref:Uncharacterized protein n=1 Tax=Papaver somniferum TaxID=3469 RepID=A0A4Y7IN63_PAPSO|nr:uncharacterized protein LOC113353578 [Papaver somniferum]RZC50117.1 hypothetical protein C5167_018544 [Papaver somniferum]
MHGRKRSSLGRWARFYFTVPRQCLFIEAVLIIKSVVETAELSMLLTYYLGEIWNEKMIVTVASWIIILERRSNIVSIVATSIKNRIGCSTAAIISCSSYTAGIILLLQATISWDSELSTYIFSRAQQILSNYHHTSWEVRNMLFDYHQTSKCVRKIFSDYQQTSRGFTLSFGDIFSSVRKMFDYHNLYLGLVLLGLGKAGFSSSCIEDCLENQLAKAQISNKDDMKRDNVIRKMISLAKCQIIGFTLGSFLSAALNNDDWVTFFQISAFLMGHALLFLLFSIVAELDIDRKEVKYLQNGLLLSALLLIFCFTLPISFKYWNNMSSVVGGGDYQANNQVVNLTNQCAADSWSTPTRIRLYDIKPTTPIRVEGTGTTPLKPLVQQYTKEFNINAPTAFSSTTSFSRNLMNIQEYQFRPT